MLREIIQEVKNKKLNCQDKKIEDAFDYAYKETEKEALKISQKTWDVFDVRVVMHGFSDIFAENLAKKLPGAKICSTEDYDGTGVWGSSWIYYKGKYYSPEVPCGVKKVEDIPYIQRVIHYQKKMPEIDCE